MSLRTSIKYCFAFGDVIVHAGIEADIASLLVMYVDANKRKPRSNHQIIPNPWWLYDLRRYAYKERGYRVYTRCYKHISHVAFVEFVRIWTCRVWNEIRLAILGIMYIELFTRSRICEAECTEGGLKKSDNKASPFRSEGQ